MADHRRPDGPEDQWQDRYRPQAPQWNTPPQRTGHAGQTGQPPQQPGRWSGLPVQAPTGPSSPSVPPATHSGQPGVTTGMFTPVTVGAAAGVLLLLTVLSYSLNWKKAVEDDGGSALVNGFGIQKIFSDGESARSLATPWFFLSLVVVLLVAAAAVLALTSVYRRIAALCLTVAGGVGLLYGLLSLVTDFGMDENFMGLTMNAAAGDTPLDFGVRFGLIFAVLVSLATLAVGLLYLLSGPGPLLPAATRAPVSGLLRPLYVASSSVLLLLLLTGSYLLDWRTVTEKDSGSRFSIGVDGLGRRTFDMYAGGETLSVTDVNLGALLTASAVIVLVAGGVLLVAATGRTLAGAVLLTGGAALSTVYTLVGLLSDLGALREWGGEDPTAGLIDSTDVSPGIFASLLLSLVLLAVAVVYLLAQFGIIGGSRRLLPQQTSGPQGFGPSGSGPSVAAPQEQGRQNPQFGGFSGGYPDHR